MKRGEVYWADLVPRSGSEQQGRRPVIVISHDAFIRHKVGDRLSLSLFQLPQRKHAVLYLEGGGLIYTEGRSVC